MAHLLLAPYNDAIQLGQGFNSFLHKPCINGAVTIPEDVLQKQAVRAGGTSNVSQNVSYSSRFVDKISDVVRSMNISAASSITSGTIEVSGNSLSVDEAKFSASDLNAVISVKVVNQTTISPKSVKFNPLDGVEMDSQKFFEIFGDCYVSGFMEGGDLHGIVSIKILDRTKKSEVESFLKGQINASGASGASGDFILGEGSGVSSINAALSETETTVTVNWSGGGPIKPDDEEWTLDSLLKAAASFPSRVAQCPQRTWAILTRYDNNRDFVKWAAGKKIVVPDFNRAQLAMSDLLDDFMEYKHNLSRLQAVMANPSAYEESTSCRDAVGMDIASLVAERKKLKAEMTKISNVVDHLNARPREILEYDIASPVEWASRLPKLKNAAASTAEGGAVAPSAMTLSELIQGLPLVDNPTPSVVQAVSSAIGDVTTSTAAFPPLGEIYAGDPAKDLSPSEAAWVSSPKNRLTYQNLQFDSPMGDITVPGTKYDYETFNNAVQFAEMVATDKWPDSASFKSLSSLAAPTNSISYVGSFAVSYPGPPVKKLLEYRVSSWDNMKVAQTHSHSLGKGLLMRARIGRKKGEGGINFVEVHTTSTKSNIGNEADSDEIREYTCPEGYGFKGWWGARGLDFIARLGPIWGRR